MSYAVGGFSAQGFDMLSKAVDQVMAGQIGRLKKTARRLISYGLAAAFVFGCGGLTAIAAISKCAPRTNWLTPMKARDGK